MARKSLMRAISVVATAVIFTGTTCAQVCDTEVSGELFCDEFGPDSGDKWSGFELSIENGIGTLSGTNVPSATARGTGAQSAVSVQAVGRLAEGGGFGIGARLTTGVTNYYIGIDDIPSPDGRIVYLALGGASIQTIHDTEVNFSARDELIAFQLDAFGDKLSYRVWPADEPMPSEPIVTVTDTRATSGDVFLWAASAQPPFLDRAAAEYAYVRIATEPITTYEPIVPEPSSALLCVASLLGILATRRYRYAT